MTQTVLILTAAGDPHASWAARGLERAKTRCHIVQSDRLATAGALSWGTEVKSCVQDADGLTVDLSNVSTIWWRRSNNQNGLDLESPDKHLINRCASAAWIGTLLRDPNIRVIDDPFTVFRAENKAIQLEVAQRAGFVIPPTLISNAPDDIRAFAQSHEAIIAKTLRHTPQTMLETVEVTLDQLQDEESLRLCPTIYQAKVPGTQHLRLLVFGDDAVGAELTSPHLDWRGRKEVRMAEYRPDIALRERCFTLLRNLRLSMAVFDLKIGPDGPIFLEINPQGQFLFLEILSGADWEDRFAAFLLELRELR